MSYQLQICINIYQGYKVMPVQDTFQLLKELRNILSFEQFKPSQATKCMV